MNTLPILNDDDFDMSTFQMESIASDLVLLLKHKGIKRSQLAKLLDWDKSRVTHVLSGDENLTIKTICAITQALGYDFDVIFFNKDYQQPKQPWQIDRSKRGKTHFNQAIFQSGNQVVRDVIAGDEAEHYIRLEVKSTKPVRTNTHKVSYDQISTIIRRMPTEVTTND